MRAEQSTFGWTTEEGKKPAAAEPASAGSRANATTKPKRTRRAATRPVAVAGDARMTMAGEPELPPDNELWDVHAAARFLKRSVSWVYHKAEDGTLPVRRLGGWGIRFVPAELRAWVVSGDDGRGR
jgi:predicted DNA-binding transcriptional regulator AlpA